MSAHPRPATDAEADRVWPAVRSARIFDEREQFAAFRAAAPWRVRVTDAGEASVLERWRSHLDVLAFRGLWSAQRHVPSFVEDACEVARAHGFARVLSPLVSLDTLRGYERAGMRTLESLVALQGDPRACAPVRLPGGVTIRRATQADLPAVLSVDEASFGEFWRYGVPEITTLFAEERMAVAEESAQVVGYTLTTVSRGAATFSRLAVAPGARRRGIGAALVAEACAYAARAGAHTIALCTQEDNTASRALYAQVGLHEIAERYAFAVRSALDLEELSGR